MNILGGTAAGELPSELQEPEGNKINKAKRGEYGSTEGSRRKREKGKFVA